MVYMFDNVEVIREDGTTVVVSGIADVITTQNGIVNCAVITDDMEEFPATIAEENCEPATMARIVNVMLDENCETEEAAIAILSERFEQLYDEMGDGQEAFDSLMYEEMNGMLNDYDLIYSVTGDNWGVEADNADEFAVATINDLYDTEAKDIDEACDVLERQITKTMSNVSCDPYTALKLEKDEGVPDCFSIKAESDKVFIEILDI